MIGCSAQVGNSVKVPVGVDADALVPNKPSEILKSPFFIISLVDETLSGSDYTTAILVSIFRITFRLADFSLEPRTLKMKL